MDAPTLPHQREEHAAGGFDESFKRQLEAHARPGDVAVAITTSGNSSNVLKAAAAAEKCVAAKALVASEPAFSALPALKPNQPTHSNPVPMSESTTLCGTIGSCGKPMRLPSTAFG